MDFRREAKRALREDRAGRDVTVQGFVPSGAGARIRLVARETGVLAGLPAAAEVFRAAGPSVRVRFLARDGDRLRPGRGVLEAVGPLGVLLSAERSALNFITHLSGIATLTRRFVDAAGPRGPAILDTRKTLPGLRDLQKYAVRQGGGTNHRRDLSDAYLIKENHLAFYAGADGRADLIRRVGRARRSGRPVEMECRDRAEILWGLEAGADILLLDNFPPRGLTAVIRWIDGLCRARGWRRPLLEVSGGVTLDRMPRLARAGVDRISIGRLTHSAPALDFNMDVVEVRGGRFSRRPGP